MRKSQTAASNPLVKEGEKRGADGWINRGALRGLCCSAWGVRGLKRCVKAVFVAYPPA